VDRFLDFCFPADLPNRQEEILLDHQYWNDASTFVISNRSNEIVGIIQFIPKKQDNKLPCEFGRAVPSENLPSTALNAIANGTLAEIYHCRKSMTLKGMDSVIVVAMLFKAVWAKVIQTNTSYSFISFDPQLNDLRNMYIRRLAFLNTGIFLSFNNDPKKWSLLFKDWKENEKKFATLGKSQFYLLTWARKNLKKKNLRIPPGVASHQPAFASPPATKDKPVLFTQIINKDRIQADADPQIPDHKKT
jgi:hypothetical protein